MQNYNIDEQAGDEYFKLILGGHTYRFRYPTTDESVDMAGLSSATTGTATPEQTRNVIDKLSGFVTPEEEGAPDFRAALGGSSVKKLRRFMEIVNQQFDPSIDAEA